MGEITAELSLTKKGKFFYERGAAIRGEDPCKPEVRLSPGISDLEPGAL